MSAWARFYKQGLKGESVPDPVGSAIIALKVELAYNGHEGAMDLTTPYFGVHMDRQTRHFQGENALEVDGVIGPKTALALYHKRFHDLEDEHGIINSYVCKVCQLESAVDPGAVGVVDPHDHGIMQINAIAHPDISLAEAFTASWSLEYFANALVANHEALNDWDAAVASWNIGSGGAKYWLAHGKPETLMFPNSTWDVGKQATEYLKLVNGRTC